MSEFLGWQHPHLAHPGESKRKDDEGTFSREYFCAKKDSFWKNIITAWWNSGTSILLASWNYFLVQQIFGKASEKLSYNPQNIDKWKMREEEEDSRRIKAYLNSFHWNFSTISQWKKYSSWQPQITYSIYKEYYSVYVPSSEMGFSHPLSRLALCLLCGDSHQCSCRK